MPGDRYNFLLQNALVVCLLFRSWLAPTHFFKEHTLTFIIEHGMSEEAVIVAPAAPSSRYRS